ncbi:hypothetical protein RUM43_011373 [Polyplax serrata]|uniref:Uncharacterized protein n=1 Tax=Polyplax serrata TaxID=468196 RepID=A0AAN8NLY0_POLSC
MTEKKIREKKFNKTAQVKKEARNRSGIRKGQLMEGENRYEAELRSANRKTEGEGRTRVASDKRQSKKPVATTKQVRRNQQGRQVQVSSPKAP